MKTEQLNIEELTLDPANARRHPEKNLEAIKGSLKRFGLQKPIVVDKNGVVIAGNGTLEAARALGWKEISVVRSELFGSDRTAYALSDNRTSELAEWNKDTLGAQLQALYEDDYGIEDFGFTVADFEISDSFNNDLDDADGESKKSSKFVVEIEFPDEQAMRDEYEVLLAKGLIARLKFG